MPVSPVSTVCMAEASRATRKRWNADRHCHIPRTTRRVDFWQLFSRRLPDRNSHPGFSSASFYFSFDISTFLPECMLCSFGMIKYIQFNLCSRYPGRNFVESVHSVLQILFVILHSTLFMWCLRGAV